jgi:hypothetical protein
MALDPANFSDIVLQVINENGANNSTTFVDQSNGAQTVDVVSATHWTNAITIAGSNVCTTGNTALDNSGFLGVGHGGSSVINPRAQDFCVEWVGQITSFRDTTYGRSVIFSFGIATVHSCLEIAVADGSTYLGAGHRICGLLASTDPGGNVWDIFGNDAGVYCDVDFNIPTGEPLYVKVIRVGSSWTVRMVVLSAPGTTYKTTSTSSQTLGDISDLSLHMPGMDGTHAVNIGSNGGIGNDEVFLGYSAFTRVTFGTSVAAMDMDGVPTLPFAGSTQTYSYSAVGGIALSGSAPRLSGRQVTATGGLYFSGSAAYTHTGTPDTYVGNAYGESPFASSAFGEVITGTSTQSYSYTTTGGMSLAGAAASVRGHIPAASGGVTISGAASVSRRRSESVSGGISFAGASSYANGVGRLATGGMTLSGAASQNRGLVTSVSGGIVLGGAATGTRGSIKTLDGGLTFSGTAPYTPTYIGASQHYAYTSTGGITFSGASSTVAGRDVVANGGLSFSGVSTNSKGRNVTPIGGYSFAGSPTTTMGRTVIASGSIVFSGTAVLRLTKYETASGGIIFGGTASYSSHFYGVAGQSKFGTYLTLGIWH